MKKLFDDSEHNRRTCNFYEKYGICSHDTVDGYNKRCIGTAKCVVYEKRLNWNETIQLLAKQDKGE